jgi:hypothetical protein
MMTYHRQHNSDCDQDDGYSATYPTAPELVVTAMKPVAKLESNVSGPAEPAALETVPVCGNVAATRVRKPLMAVTPFWSAARMPL